jgi:hypothetical protein
MSQDALELLLNGVKDQAQRKQITSAYYAFASGDPETFAVQFAVLLRAHAMSLKLLPARLEKSLSAETRKLGDLVIAHQNAIGRMASLIDQTGRNDGVGEGDGGLLEDPTGNRRAARRPRRSSQKRKRKDDLRCRRAWKASAKAGSSPDPFGCDLELYRRGSHDPPFPRTPFFRRGDASLK